MLVALNSGSLIKFEIAKNYICQLQTGCIIYGLSNEENQTPKTHFSQFYFIFSFSSIFRSVIGGTYDLNRWFNPETAATTTTNAKLIKLNAKNRCFFFCLLILIKLIVKVKSKQNHYEEQSIGHLLDTHTHKFMDSNKV